MKNDRQNTKMLKGIKAKLLKILLPVSYTHLTLPTILLV